MPSGSCLCKNLKYEYTNPKMKALCHCLTCRKITGSTYATTILVPEENFKDTGEGKPKTTVTTHESGMTITPYSCDKCYCTIYKKASGFPGQVVVFAGTLDGEDPLLENEAKPDAELWIKYRVGWQPALEGTMQCEEFPTS